MRLIRGLFLKPTLNLLSWILKRGNSLIIGGPQGWSWQSTLDTTHHGSLAGPANAHRHSDLANIGINDHHDRDHAARHASGQPDAVSLDASQIGSGRFGMPRMPAGTSGQVLTAQGAGVDPAYESPSSIPSGLIAMWHGLIANIPSGWVICDGNNGTPNLLAKFVEGVATAATNPGASGGESSHTLSVSELPAHTHRVVDYTGGASGSRDEVEATHYSYNPVLVGYKWSGLIETVGSGSAHENKPPFYDVAYIMKI